MADDYGYINARLRAMKSRLLKKQEYQSALGAESTDDLLAFLGTTPYGPDIAQAMTVKKGLAGIDEGLRRELQKSFDAVVRMTSDRPRELLLIVMGRWELLNVKTLLRGKHSHATPEAMLANMVPFGRLDDVALAEAVKQADVKGIVDLLSQWGIPYVRRLRNLFHLYREKEDLHILELALDRSFFDAAMRGLDEGVVDDAQVLELLRQEVDLLLLGYAMRCIHFGIREQDPAAVFIPGGKAIDQTVFMRMLASRDMEELAKATGVPSYTQCLESGLFAYTENRRISTLERALEICFVKNTCQGITRDPLSISVAIAYLWLKVNEVTNLRVISRGSFTRMPREEIEKNIVVM